MAMRDVKNVRVINVDQSDGPIVYFEHGEFSYNYKFNNPPILYKLPIFPLKKTVARRLHPYTGPNRALIDSANAVVNHLDLIGRAKAALATERADKEAAQRESLAMAETANRTFDSIQHMVNNGAHSYLLTIEQMRALLYYRDA